MSMEYSLRLLIILVEPHGDKKYLSFNLAILISLIIVPFDLGKVLKIFLHDLYVFHTKHNNNIMLSGSTHDIFSVIVVVELDQTIRRVSFSF
jgi:hypothetical protein